MKNLISVIVLFLFACQQHVEIVTPVVGSVTESVYASGIIKSENQYQAYATVSGIISELLVSEGDTVVPGQPLLRISNETQQLMKSNAQLTAAYNDAQANRGKLDEAKMVMDLAKEKMVLDSELYAKQVHLYEQQVGSRNELDQRELNWRNSRTAWVSARVRFRDLQRQLHLLDEQSRNNARISARQEGDYTLRSMVQGRVYDIYKHRGEIVVPQTPIALLGASDQFILEMQVDEYDIIRIAKGQLVLLSFDAYGHTLFEATVSQVDPVMNERTRTFKVEAHFKKPPQVLYPNMTFEANIVIRKEEKALLIPRNILINDSTVMLKNGENRTVHTGLKDYQMIQIVSGLTSDDQLIIPQR